MLSKIKTKIPKPLIQDLPEFLTTRGARTPTISALFPIFIRENGLKGAPMQIEVKHICTREGRLPSGGEKEFIHRSCTQHPNGRFGRGGGRMRRHDQTHTAFRGKEVQVWAIEEGTTGSTLGMRRVLIWRLAQSGNYCGQIEQPVVLATDDEPDSR